MSGAATHTPGPWVAKDGTLFGSDGSPVISTVPVSVYGESCRHLITPVNEANARLIAAAPDLLVALRNFLAEADAGHVSIETDFAARNAIRKATEGRNNG